MIGNHKHILPEWLQYDDFYFAFILMSIVVLIALLGSLLDCAKKDDDDFNDKI